MNNVEPLGSSFGAGRGAFRRLRVGGSWRTLPDMIDDDYFDWQPAVLCRPGAVPVDHRVPLINGRPPGELDRPRGDGTYDRYRLVQNDDERAVYEIVEPQAS